MAPRVDLVYLGGTTASLAWPLGEVWTADATPGAVAAVIDKRLGASQADAWLFWHQGPGMPAAERIEKALNLPGHVWHAGLRLGTGGKPGLIDFVEPTWSLNRDPSPDVEATSWRVSLHACLVQTEVLRQMGGVNPNFETLAGAALEMGLRYIRRGVLVRHLPGLVEDGGVAPGEHLTYEDELRCISYCYGAKWAAWAAVRAVLTGYTRPVPAMRAWRKVSPEAHPPEPDAYESAEEAERVKMAPVERARVTVLIPTLERYDYLRTLIGQLRQQTIPPLEILVIDQTPAGRRDTSLVADFAGLPLEVVHLDRPGQCTSRNAGLARARGTHVLFIDDDDEVPPDLIEAHLVNLATYQSEVSSGAAHEVGAGPLPEMFTYVRASDGFPTNNTMIRRSVLRQSGLFDLAFDRAARADADLGMRIYLSGALMVYSPSIAVLHHHAPRGGLRAHKARVVTYASSRRRLTHRHLPSASEIYLARRYFSPRQVREALWLRTLGTFSAHGSIGRRLLKAIVSAILLPDTWWQVRRASRRASRMLQDFPDIPALAGPAQAQRAQV